MKTDLYTKIVLTIIALCLIVIVAEKGLISKVHAAPSPQSVIVPINSDGTINVRVMNSNPGEVIIAGWKDTNFNAETRDLTEWPLPVTK